MDNGINAAGVDSEALANLQKIFLGTTGQDGQVSHTFTGQGRYLLVAFKSGHAPGLALLVVKKVPKALGIRAPRTAEPDEEVTITVFDRRTEEAILT